MKDFIPENMPLSIKCSFCDSKNIDVDSRKRNSATAFYYYRCKYLCIGLILRIGTFSLYIFKFIFA